MINAAIGYTVLRSFTTHDLHIIKCKINRWNCTRILLDTQHL